MIGIFDIVKFILSFLVISIHVEPLASINPNIDFLINNSICRIAVPIFFSIAGFLFYNKITNKKSDYKLYFKKYIKRIIIMYLFWSLVYFIPYFYQNPSTGRLIKFIPHLLIHEWIHFLYEIIVPENSIFSNSLISYFVICMISILLSYSFYKLSNTKRFSILKKVY